MLAVTTNILKTLANKQTKNVNAETISIGHKTKPLIKTKKHLDICFFCVYVG